MLNSRRILSAYSVAHRMMTMLVLSLSAMLCGVIISPGIAAAENETQSGDGDMDISALLADAKQAQDEVSSLQSEYVSAVQLKEDLSKQAKNETASLDELNKELADETESLNRLISDEYKSNIPLMTIRSVLGAGSISDAARAIEYANMITERERRKADNIREMRDEQKAMPEIIQEKKAQADEQSGMSETYRADLESKLKDLSPKIIEYEKALNDKIGDQAASRDQLASILSFLKQAGTTSDEQARIVESAYSTGYAGSERCEAWVEAVYRKAGVKISMYPSAWDNCKANMKSTDLDHVPTGALIFGSGSSPQYNHVGIVVLGCDGDRSTMRIIDNEGSRTGTQSFDEWASWQTTPSSHTGTSGVFGWGYPS